MVSVVEAGFAVLAVVGSLGASAGALVALAGFAFAFASAGAFAAVSENDAVGSETAWGLHAAGTVGAVAVESALGGPPGALAAAKSVVAAAAAVALALAVAAAVFAALASADAAAAAALVAADHERGTGGLVTARTAAAVVASAVETAEHGPGPGLVGWPAGDWPALVLAPALALLLRVLSALPPAVPSTFETFQLSVGSAAAANTVAAHKRPASGWLEVSTQVSGALGAVAESVAEWSAASYITAAAGFRAHCKPLPVMLYSHGLL